MILGRIIGKVTTLNFEFEVTGDAKKFAYCQVQHKDYGFVLCQIIEIITDAEKTLAKCNIIGYKEDNAIRQIRTPFEPGTEVLQAEDDFVKKIVQINEEGAYIGKLEGKDIKVHLDFNKLLTKHLAILAKTGSGKSYALGVLVEEMIQKKVPVLIIDPHGEYYSLKYPAEEGKGFFENIAEYGLPDKNIKQLKLANNISSGEFMHMLPTKLSNSQQALLYTALQNTEKVDFDELKTNLSYQDNTSKWQVIQAVDYLKGLDIFSHNFTQYNELIKPGTCSIINLKGIAPEVQEIIVYKLLKDLFEERKKKNIPPFFAIIEEAHNFCPERGFAESKALPILRTIASEGRKFGLGLCIVSQRPAKVDKNVLSQCSTQIILKVTNPNDLKAISSSVEGLAGKVEDEIQNLPIGTALLAGVVDMPLFVQIRTRLTKHGGSTQNILQDVSPVEEVKDFDLLPLVKPRTTIKDIKLMLEDNIDIQTYLIPAVMMTCKSKSNEFNVLVELVKGNIIMDVEKENPIPIIDLTNFSTQELQVIEASLHSLVFTPGLITKETNLSPFAVETIIQNLQKQDLFTFDGTRYKIQEFLRLISHTNDYAFFGKIDYEKINFDEKIEKNVDLEEVKKKIAMFTDVIEAKDCYIVKYFYDKE